MVTLLCFFLEFKFEFEHLVCNVEVSTLTDEDLNHVVVAGGGGHVQTRSPRIVRHLQFGLLGCILPTSFYLEQLSGSGEEESNNSNMAGETGEVERDVTTWFARSVHLGSEKYKKSTNESEK